MGWYKLQASAETQYRVSSIIIVCNDMKGSECRVCHIAGSGKQNN